MNFSNYHLDSRWKVVQHQVAMMLGTGHTIADAAKKANITSRTIYRWLDDHDFKRFVEGMKSKAFDEAMGIIANTTTKAAQKLSSLIDSQDESIGLRASSEVFGTAFKGRAEAKINDINDRVKDMQARLNGTSGANGHADTISHADANSNGSNGEEDKQTSTGSSQESNSSLANIIVRDDEFADVLPVIKPDDGDAPMVGHIREDATRRGRPRRNGHANGHPSPQNGNGAS
jgi:hypothetical protein